MKRAVIKVEMDDQHPSSSSFTKQQKVVVKMEDGQEDKKFKIESKPENENQAEIEMKSCIDDLPPEVKKENQQPSSLSPKPQKMVKIENGQEDKKMKVESKPEIENQVEVEMKSYDDLPPEMLIKILENLNIKSLLFSRVVNRQWCGIATEILKSRDDVYIPFHYTESKKNCFVGKSVAFLADFMNCWKNSKNFPYTRFLVNVGKGSILFDHKDWNKFISDFGENIKCLKLRSRLDSDKDLMEFTKKLRFLLVSQLPKLEELGLAFRLTSRKISKASSSIQLFPPNPNAPIRLAHLKVLHVDSNFLHSGQFTGILTDLLCASTNLQKIEPFGYYGLSSTGVECFYLLHSLGKLGCLQTTTFLLSAKFLSQLKEKLSVPLGFKLKKLDVDTESVYKDRNSWSDAALFISNLFEACKDTLKEMETGPLEFLPGLQIPKFSKLNSLALSRACGRYRGHHALDLGFAWTKFFPPQESIPGFPKLKSLVIPGTGMTEQVITRISEHCPNLNNFAIYPEPLENFPQVTTAIWTRMKNLQSLCLGIDMDSPSNAFPAIDSCITGFSGEDCIRLHKFIQAAELSKTQGSQIKLEAESKSQSILNLKDLKNLTVHLVFYRCANGEYSKTAMGKNEKILAVSKKYAFQLMKNLSYKIENSLL